MDDAFATNNILLNRIVNGDEKAFRQLYDQYAGNVYSVAMYYFHSHLLAQDLVQEVFLKIWVKRVELSDVKHIKSYLEKMTRNMVIDQLRKHIIKTTAIEEEGSVDKIAELNTSDTGHVDVSHYIQLAIDRLSPQQKKVYLLSKECGLSLKQVAEEMSISYNTAREYMSLALKNIRTFLKENLKDLYVLALIFILN